MVLILLAMAAALYAQDTMIDIGGSVEWERREINTALTLNLAQAGIRLPSGRAQAEEIINSEYLQLIQPFLLSIPVDSSNTIADLMNRGEFSSHQAGIIALSARKVPPSLSADLTFLSTLYTIDLKRLSSELIQHSRPMEIARPLIPAPAAAYTGIIIIANTSLPVHGRNTSSLPLPCLFPKIWDTEMNLIYERNMMNPETAQRAGLVRYVPESSVLYSSPSGIAPDLIALVGENPLRIMARGVFGLRPTDPIIDRADALLILSSEENRRLLREGRVVMVLNEGVLKSPWQK
ncbi:MAG: polymerase [Treponema sp.]|jgi:hypothetical protein|nr:polymerase [Treponema sp.]